MIQRFELAVIYAVLATNILFPLLESNQCNSFLEINCMENFSLSLNFSLPSSNSIKNKLQLHEKTLNPVCQAEISTHLFSGGLEPSVYLSQLRISI